MTTGIICVEQRVAIGGQFNGTEPTTTPVDTDGIRIYPPCATGGKFDPVGSVLAVFRKERFWSIERIVADLRGIPVGGTYSLYIVTSSGKSVLWMTGGPTQVIYNQTRDGLSLMNDEHLQLFTSAPTVGSELFVRIFGRPLGHLV
jgi:hypothetical protein